jgi:hypothetical protein
LARKSVGIACALFLAWGQSAHADLRASSALTVLAPGTAPLQALSALTGYRSGGAAERVFSDHWLADCIGIDCFANDLRPAAKATERDADQADRRSGIAAGACLPALLGLGFWHLAKARRQVQGLPLPCWYDADAPTRIGHRVLFDLQYAPFEGPRFELPVQSGRSEFAGVWDSTWCFRPQCFLKQSSPRGPPA